MQLTKDTAAVGVKVVINENMASRRLTPGKVYTITRVDNTTATVIADDAQKGTFYFNRFDIFEEKKVKCWVCIKGSHSVVEGSHYPIEGTPRRDNLLLINGYWQSMSRFKVVELPEEKLIPPKSLAQLLKEAQDRAEGHIRMCSYAVMNDKGAVKYLVNDICHARIRPYDLSGKYVGVSLIVGAHSDKIRIQQSAEAEALYRRAVDYILHRSPWASIFINKDFKNNFGCVDLDVNRGINAVACAAIALRTCSEYVEANETFCALVNAGIDEHVSYIVAHQCVRNGIGNNGGGHHVFSSACSKRSVFDFFKTGKFLDEGTPYKDNKDPYLIIGSQFEEYADHNNKIGTVLIDIAAKCKTIGKSERWSGVIYTWEASNNLIPVAQQLEKEFQNV